ncbi:MAG: iron-containing alcohol dehydrogenase [Gammaproteobacteria bacterium]|nr:iron-containing alcohol dehydrogenase [Gammaproteobacteria bacterium]
MPAFYKVLGYKFVLAVTRRAVSKPQPRPVVYVGNDSSRQLCRSIAHFGLKNILVVTDKPLVALGLVDIAVQALAEHGVATHIYDGILPDPTLSVVEAGLAALKQQHCDGVLAFGGGSSMDSAKVIALAAANDMSIVDCIGFNKAKKPTLPLFVIPTTAGTGSEVTLAAILSDDETHAKMPVVDFKLIPSAAALDPVIMKGLPPHITAATGMDALTHAIESYIGQWSTEETSQYGRAATKLIFDNLQTAYENGDDLAAREAMALGSYYAGLAFTQAMVGYVHAVSHQLGAHYNVPHGLGNAMVLPHMLELLKGAAAGKLAELAVYSGIGTESEPESALAQKLIDRVWELNAAIGIPKTTDVIQEQDIDAIVEAALKEGNGYPVPRFIEKSECEALVRGLRSV